MRPHPQNAAQWEHVDLAAEFEGVALWPRTGVNPIGGVARADYFDSIYHCEAVVGVNTSAMIESGIIGRPVYSVTVDDFAATQEGTLHFQHLKHAGGGLLHLAGDLDEHLEQLAALLAEPRTRRVRVRGSSSRRSSGRMAWTSPATPRVVETHRGIAAAPALGGDRSLGAYPTPAHGLAARRCAAPPSSPWSD